MIAILATFACQAGTHARRGAAAVEASTGIGNVVASNVPPPPPVVVHAEATGPRALSEVVFAIADQNFWSVAYEDAPIRAPVDLVSSESRGVVTPIPRTYTDRVDYDPTAGAKAALTALVASHNQAGNPGVFEVRTIGDVTDVVGIGALDASGRYAAVTPLLDTIVTLPPKARTISQGTEEVLEQLDEETGQTVGDNVAAGLSRGDTSASTSGDSARSVLSKMLLEGEDRATWELLHGAGTDLWVFSSRWVVEPPPPPPSDPRSLPHLPRPPQ